MSEGAFAGKVAMVTGGGSGIGRATALALAREGASVLIGDVNEAGANEAAAAIGKLGGVAEAIRLDVADSESVAAAVARACRAFGGLHVGVNCAGVTLAGDLLLDVAEDGFDQVIDVNLKGTWRCLRAQIPAIIASGGGAIVNVSSTMGLVASIRSSSYIASKHGIVGLTKAASMEYASQGVRVNAVCPGGTATPMVSEEVQAALVPLHPIGRISDPAEISAAILFLASPAASFVTGVALPVDGGWTSH